MELAGSPVLWSDFCHSYIFTGSYKYKAYSVLLVMVNIISTELQSGLHLLPTFNLTLFPPSPLHLFLLLCLPLSSLFLFPFPLFSFPFYSFFFYVFLLSPPLFSFPFYSTSYSSCYFSAVEQEFISTCSLSVNCDSREHFHYLLSPDLS